jgi:hypothetical protein
MLNYFDDSGAPKCMVTSIHAEVGYWILRWDTRIGYWILTWDQESWYPSWVVKKILISYPVHELAVGARQPASVAQLVRA